MEAIYLEPIDIHRYMYHILIHMHVYIYSVYIFRGKQSKSIIQKVK